MEISEWKKSVEAERKAKDDFFGMPYQSPLNPDECEKFKRP